MRGKLFVKRPNACSHKSRDRKAKKHIKVLRKKGDENWQNNLNNIRNGRERKKLFIALKQRLAKAFSLSLSLPLVRQT